MTLLAKVSSKIQGTRNRLYLLMGRAAKSIAKGRDAGGSEKLRTFFCNQSTLRFFSNSNLHVCFKIWSSSAFPRKLYLTPPLSSHGIRADSSHSSLHTVTPSRHSHWPAPTPPKPSCAPCLQRTMNERVVSFLCMWPKCLVNLAVEHALKSLNYGVRMPLFQSYLCLLLRPAEQLINLFLCTV